MPKTHKVVSGECATSIATKYGFFWNTVWSDPGNSELSGKRSSPEILLPGDELHIPDLRVKTESAPTEQKAQFRRKGIPALFVLQVLKEPEQRELEEDVADPAAEITEDPKIDETLEREPESNAPFQLTIDGALQDGTTDADGKLEVALPPMAEHLTLILHPGAREERRIEMELGRLDPISELSGVAQRLANLGLACGVPTDEITPELAEALMVFQKEQGLDQTSEPDDTTVARLEELHGS